MGRTALLIGTRKGAWILVGDAARQRWEVRGPHKLGHIVHHLVLDPRDGTTLLMAASTGHLGPTLFRSTDLGQTWTEAASPPAFPKAPEGQVGRAVKHLFWLQPGHAHEPGAWYAGTSPKGLFRSADGGDTWTSVSGFNDHPMNAAWVGPPEWQPPGGGSIHSILIDPRDKRHMYLSLSTGGVFESTDQAADWAPLNTGCDADFLPDPTAAFGHDPHCVRMHPLDPDRLYQQNHCGVYRLDRPEGRWVRIGRNLPDEVGDVGFPLVLHPRDRQTAWVFPMDGTLVWPRTNVLGRPAAYVTRDGGESWQRQDRGLPPEQAWWNVKRQAMAVDAEDSPGVYVGTTSGQIYGSVEGERWTPIVAHLPEVFALEAVALG